jgi:hypothetical protein
MKRHFLTISVSSFLIVILTSTFGMSLAIEFAHPHGSSPHLPHSFRDLGHKADSHPSDDSTEDHPSHGHYHSSSNSEPCPSELRCD